MFVSSGPASFAFGPSPSQPFYSLETFNTREAAIHRMRPSKAMVKVPVLFLALESERRRLPPHDGLVSCIFPKLAAMLAIDQSSELAAAYGVSPAHRDEMQAEAVARAAAQESCQLRWNENGRRYELTHPAIGKKATGGPHFTQSPAPTGENGEDSVFHITVSGHTLSSPRSANFRPPVIMVTDPHQDAAVLATPSHSRSSTLPIHESNEPLMSLDLGTMSLHISAKAILELMPSLYAIDCLVSAVLAVAMADSITNSVMAEMEIKSPQASPSVSRNKFAAGSVAGRSYGGSTLYATIAEREEAEHADNLMRQLHKTTKPASSGGKARKKPFWRWGQSSAEPKSRKEEERKKKKKKQQQSKKILVTEFDIEKLCHYQSGDREGQELPTITTCLVKGLVMTLQCVVWTLTTLVRVLAWILVGVTRAVTSEKF